MDRKDIHVGLKVADTSIKFSYTWVAGQRKVSDDVIDILCSMCGYPDSFMLYENEPVVNTFGDSYRAYYCVDCAGIEDLVPVFTTV
jgi:hypothetical protein